MWMELISCRPADGADGRRSVAADRGPTWVLALLVWRRRRCLRAWNRRHHISKPEPASRRRPFWASSGRWSDRRRQPAVITAVLVLETSAFPRCSGARHQPAEVWVEFSTRFDAKSALAHAAV
jgi:hypothetical protein